LHTGFFGFTPKPTGLVRSSTALKFVLEFSLPIALFLAVGTFAGLWNLFWASGLVHLVYAKKRKRKAKNLRRRHLL
jgi:hypothetical protein